MEERCHLKNWDPSVEWMLYLYKCSLAQFNTFYIFFSKSIFGVKNANEVYICTVHGMCLLHFNVLIAYPKISMSCLNTVIFLDESTGETSCCKNCPTSYHLLILSCHNIPSRPTFVDFFLKNIRTSWNLNIVFQSKLCLLFLTDFSSC